jgi:hypothetical protein
MKLRTVFAGAGVFVLAALSFQSGNCYVSQKALEKLARAGGLTFAQVIAYPWRSQARIVGLSLEASDFHIHVGALNLPAGSLLFSPIAAAIAGTDSASAEDVTIETGSSTYKIKRINLSGASLSTAELAQILDPKNAAPIAERFGKISAALITIPEIIGQTKFGATTQKIVFRDIALNGLVQGKAAAASASGASFSISDPQRGKAEGGYGQISAKAVDLVVAARILTQTRDQTDAPRSPLYDSIALDGFHLTNLEAQFELDVGSLTAAGAKGRPPRKPWAEVQPADSNPSESGKPRAFLAEALDSFEIDDVAASDVKLTVLANGDPASFRLARISMSRLGDAKISALEAQNLGFSGAAGKIDLDGLTLRGVDFKSSGGADDSSTDALPMPNLIEKDLLPQVEQIVLTKLDVDLTNAPSGQLESSPVPSGSVFKADRLEVDRKKDDAAVGLDLALDHLTASLNEAGPFASLAAMGYEQLDVSSRLQLAWTATSRELEIKTFSLAGADMGTLKIVGLINNVTSDLGSSDQSAAAAAARNLLLKKLDVRIANEGVVEKALAAQAKGQKKSVEAMRHSDEIVASLVLPALLGNGPPARALGAALARFIADPKTLHLVAVSPQGVGLADLDLMRTPGALFDRVEIEASVNQ